MHRIDLLQSFFQSCRNKHNTELSQIFICHPPPPPNVQKYFLLKISEKCPINIHEKSHKTVKNQNFYKRIAVFLDIVSKMIFSQFHRVWPVACSQTENTRKMPLNTRKFEKTEETSGNIVIKIIFKKNGFLCHRGSVTCSLS